MLVLVPGRSVLCQRPLMNEQRVVSFFIVLVVHFVSMFVTV